MVNPTNFKTSINSRHSNSTWWRNHYWCKWWSCCCRRFYCYHRTWCICHHSTTFWSIRIASFAIEDGGGQHQVGDTVAISGAGGTAARATVATVTDQSAITFEVKNGGSGYRANVIYSTSESAGNFENPAITGGSGQGASFRVVSITDTEALSLNTDLIVELQNVQIGADPFSTGPEGANISATLASSNAYSQLQNALTFTSSGTIGAIDEIEVLDPGFDYSTFPSVQPVDYVVQDFLGAEFPDDTGVGGFKGSNAVIVANNMPGAIETLTITTAGSSYDRQQRADVTNLDRANTFAATGFATPTALSNVEGFYVDTNRGILGGDNVLQDNFYYQEYSYVLKTPINTSVYRAVIDKLLHPSGTKMFTEVQIRAEISFPVTVESIGSELEINQESEIDVLPLAVNIEVLPAEVSIRSPIEIGPADVTQTTFDVVDSEISFRLDDVGDIASTVVVTEDTGVGSPTEPELVLFIEEPTSIESTAFIAGDVPIEALEDVVIGASPNTYGDDVNFAAEDQVQYAEFATSDEDSRIGDALGLHALRPVYPIDDGIASTATFGTNELILSIEGVGAIASTVVVTADTGVGQPSEPELVTFIEEAGAIASTITFSGQDTISPMADVELNQNPFNNDPDIGEVTPELGGANVNTQFSTAIPGITVSHV